MAWWRWGLNRDEDSYHNTTFNACIGRKLRATHAADGRGNDTPLRHARGGIRQDTQNHGGEFGGKLSLSTALSLRYSHPWFGRTNILPTEPSAGHAGTRVIKIWPNTTRLLVVRDWMRSCPCWPQGAGNGRFGICEPCYAVLLPRHRGCGNVQEFRLRSRIEKPPWHPYHRTRRPEQNLPQDIQWHYAIQARQGRLVYRVRPFTIIFFFRKSIL